MAQSDLTASQERWHALSSRSETPAHTLMRFVAWVCLFAAVIVPFSALTIWDLTVAANVAQLVSVPLAAAGLLGVSLFPKVGTHQPTRVSELAEPPPPAIEPTGPSETTTRSSTAASLQNETPENDRQPTRERRAHRLSTLGAVMRYSGIGLGTLLAVASVLIWADPAIGQGSGQTTYASQVAQPISVIDGTRPVIFKGGTNWRWLDLPSGLSIVTFSPGGGVKNYGLQEVGGTITYIGSCADIPGRIDWRFKTDGRLLNKKSSYDMTVDLPDHLDVLSLEIDVAQHEGCAIGLEWDHPSVIRIGPVPER